MQCGTLCYERCREDGRGGMRPAGSYERTRLGSQAFECVTTELRAQTSMSERVVPFDPAGDIWSRCWTSNDVHRDGRVKRPRPLSAAAVAGVRGVRALRDSKKGEADSDEIEVLKRRLAFAQAYNARLLSIMHVLTARLSEKRGAR